MSKDLSQLHKDLARLAKETEKMTKQDAPRIAGTQAVKHTKQNFQAEGFISGGGVQKWPKKQRNPKNKPILQETGNLKDSIRYWTDGKNVKIGVDLNLVPYAKAHNEGLTIRVPVTQKSRDFFWHMYYKTKDSKWKAMALTKKSSFTIDLDKRKYLGITDDIIQSISRELDVRFDKLIKQIS